MRSKSVLILITSVFLLTTATNGLGQKSRDFKMTISGTGVMPLGVEINGNPVGTGFCAGSSTLRRWGYPAAGTPGSGEFTCTTTGYAKFEPQSQWEAQTDNCPSGFEAEIVEVENNHIVRFADGDMMWWLVDQDAYNYGCFQFDGTGIQVLSWDIIGGSGKYRGVTGTATWWIPATPVPLGPDPLGMWAAHDGVVEGTIIY